MQEGYDGRVKSVEGFSNGYTFKEAVPKHEETQDEGKNRLDQGVSMAFTYEKEGMEDVELSGSRLFVGMQDKSSADQVMTLEDDHRGREEAPGGGKAERGLRKR